MSRDRRINSSTSAIRSASIRICARLFKLTATFGCWSPKAASAISRDRRINGSASLGGLVLCSSCAESFDVIATSFEFSSSLASAGAWRSCSSDSFHHARSISTFAILKRYAIRSSVLPALPSASCRNARLVSNDVRRVSPFPISASRCANASNSPVRRVSQAAIISSISERWAGVGGVLATTRAIERLTSSPARGMALHRYLAASSTTPRRAKILAMSSFAVARSTSSPRRLRSVRRALSLHPNCLLRAASHAARVAFRHGPQFSGKQD